jgi:hypothetical protein
MVQIQAVAVLSLSLACAQAEDSEFQQSEQLNTPDAAATQGSQDTLPPELTPTTAAKIPPFPPTKVAVKSEGRRSTVTWQASPVDTVVKYRIYRKMPGEKRLIKIGETDTSRFVDPATTRGAEYAVTAVNVYGAETPLSSTPLNRDVPSGRATGSSGRSNQP